MTLWLDDLREPWKYGHIGATWVKTAQEAIDVLATGQVTRASLDHDLREEHYPWNYTDINTLKDTGFEVAKFLMETPGLYPRDGVNIHSHNEEGSERMFELLRMYFPNVTANQA